MAGLVPETVPSFAMMLSVEPTVAGVGLNVTVAMPFGCVSVGLVRTCPSRRQKDHVTERPARSRSRCR